MGAVSWVDESPAILEVDIENLSGLHRQAIFHNRAVDSVSWLADGRFAIYWKVDSDVAESKLGLLVSLPDKGVVAIEIHQTGDDLPGCVLMNADNELVMWMLRIERACSKGECGLSPQQFQLLKDLLCDATRYTASKMGKFAEYFKGWNNLDELTDDLRPPGIEISSDMFFLRCPTQEEK
jgi:hypothetical protein